MVFIIIGAGFLAGCFLFALTVPFMLVTASVIVGLAAAGFIAAGVEAAETAGEDADAWFNETWRIIEEWFNVEFVGFFTTAQDEVDKLAD